VQADIIAISNTNGVITDFESNEDELAVWMGVNDDILITWRDTIVPNEEKAFPIGVLTFPCFYESVFWIELEEDDNFIIDKAQVAVDCKNL